jgi:uncharacterized protein (DUF1778 family)
MEERRQKNLRLNRDQRVLLDTLRQYAGSASESDAGALAVVTAAEQLLASYLAGRIHQARCDLLLAALNAVAPVSPRPTYQIDSESRLLRWHEPKQEYLPVLAAVAPWLPKA